LHCYGGAAKANAVTILTALLDASIAMDQHRLQELFCGFVRRESEGPALYPVACSPQAWASTSVFYLLQACLGLSFSPNEPRVRIDCPVLPEFMKTVRISNLRVGDAVVDLAFEGHQRDVSVNVLRKTGEVEVAVLL
jgi:glycogen debranching enzyme